MAIRRKNAFDSEITIDLTGPDGNAFVLLGRAKGYAKQIDLDGDKIIHEMTQGDYEHLVETFDKYFGLFVTLLR